MPQLIVLSLIGTDHPGVVKDISKTIFDCGGNIEESRMTTLGAEFAVLMLISGNWHTPAKLEKALGDLAGHHDLSINLKKTEIGAVRGTYVFNTDDRERTRISVHRTIA